MTIKELLLQEIDSTDDPLLEETLDFLRFLKTKQKRLERPSTPIESKTVPSTAQTDSEKQSTNTEQSYRPASGRSILRHVGTWAGDDFEECLEMVYATRGKAKFYYDSNPFDE